MKTHNGEERDGGLHMKERTYRLTVDGIPITVVKKKMKNMYLRIKKEDGSVLISAPHQVSDGRIREFAEGKMDWIREHREIYKKQNADRMEKPVLSEAELLDKKRLLFEKAAELVLKWEPVMQVKVSGISIKQMKTRWGSCNVKTHHINLNLALSDKKPECLEYVVVHEMCHILEASHNRVFWEYMTRFFPDWKRVKKELGYLN